MWYCPACVFPEWVCQSTFSEGKKAKKEIQKRKGTIKKAGKLKKSEVTKTADDEYDDKWEQKTIQFLRERPPEQHHWEELCRFCRHRDIPDESASARFVSSLPKSRRPKPLRGL